MESKSIWWWKLLAGHRRALLLGLGSTLLCSLAAAWVPFWSGRAVHALETNRYGDSRHALIWMLLFTLAAGIGRYLMRNTLIGLSREIEKVQREEIYAFLMTRSFAFYEKQRIGDLMSRIGDDVSTVRMATGPGFMSLLQTFSILPMTMALMLHTHARLTFAVMLPFSFLALGFYLLSKKSHTLQQKLQLVSSQLNTFSHETIQGEKVVQAFGLEDLRVGRFRELSEDQARLNIRQSSILGAYGPMAALIGGVASLVLVAYGGALLTRHELSLGDLTAFTGYLVALAWPVMSLGWSVNLFQRARAGQERIEEVLTSPEPAVPPLPQDEAGEAPELPSAPAEIALTDALFRFESGRGLGPISLKVASGGSLAVVGSIGSGKSILLQTLAGLRTIQEGRYEVDGQPLGDATLRRHWAGLGWVPQEAFLFSTSLRKNLTQGKPDASEADIWEVAEVVCLDDLIRRLPAGLDTVVGERGVVLSGGERQRTALARALLKKPRLLLMDDALSAVDAETESRILENLKSYLGRTTLVLATHRIFVAELCEDVLVMEQGHAIQFGTAAQLAEQQGLYARLKRLQSLEREILGGAGA